MPIFSLSGRLDRSTAAPLRRQLLSNAHFEVIPLKNLAEQLQHLPAGASVSVTASPNKSLEDTWQLARDLLDRGFRPIPHLASRMLQSRQQLESLIKELRALGLTELFLVGGDAASPHGPYEDSIQVLQAILELDHTLEHIGVTAYPDGHSFIETKVLSSVLRAKQEILKDAGLASHAATQMCFDPATIRDWLERERDSGLEIPVHLGIPGAVERKKLLSVGARLGVGASLRYLQKNTGTLARMVMPGGYNPNKLLSPLAGDLQRLGIQGLHIFTFNQVDTTVAWRNDAISSLKS
ncbi:MAG: methylenetetrahydrofolate reductase [Actinomycetota bacterium]|nr:methylenetetrahydrofolate reductase [Actinomycetota bacterium]